MSVEYERNPQYWKEGLPYIDGMKHFVMTDSGRIIAAYKTGQILTSNQYGYNLTNAEAQQLDKDMDNLTVHWGPAEFARYVMMNSTKAPFDNADVRRAVHLALNRQAILAATAAGQGVPGYPLPPGLWYSNTDEEYANMPGYRLLDGQKHPEDLATAKSLLTQAGVDGSLELKLNARNCCGYPPVAVLVKEQLVNAFGWDITIETLESGAGFDKYWAGDFTIAVQGGNIWSSDPDAVGSRHIRGTTMQWTGGGAVSASYPPAWTRFTKRSNGSLTKRSGGPWCNRWASSSKLVRPTRTSTGPGSTGRWSTESKTSTIPAKVGPGSTFGATRRAATSSPDRQSSALGTFPGRGTCPSQSFKLESVVAPLSQWLYKPPWLYRRRPSAGWAGSQLSKNGGPAWSRGWPTSNAMLRGYDGMVTGAVWAR